MTDEFVAPDYGKARRHVAIRYPELEKNSTIEVHGCWPVEVHIADEDGDVDCRSTQRSTLSCRSAAR